MVVNAEMTVFWQVHTSDRQAGDVSTTILQRLSGANAAVSGTRGYLR